MAGTWVSIGWVAKVGLGSSETLPLSQARAFSSAPTLQAGIEGSSLADLLICPVGDRLTGYVDTTKPMEQSGGVWCVDSRRPMCVHAGNLEC